MVRGKRGGGVAAPTSSMDLDDDLKVYLSNLIEPLAKSTEVAELLRQINEQKTEIAALKKDIVARDARILALETESARLAHNQDLVRRRADDSEQYDRRYSCRINGIPVGNSGEQEDVKAIVKDCYEKMNLPFDANKIDRCHRVGKPSLDRVSNQETQQIIVKFRSWDSRCAFYKARPKKDSSGSSDPDSSATVLSDSNPVPVDGESVSAPRFGVALDLTRDRYKLLQAARSKVADNPDVKFACADINCRLTIRMKNGKFHHFSSMQELEKVLSVDAVNTN